MNRLIRFGASVLLVALLLFISSGFVNVPTKASSLPPEACDTTADLVPLVTDQTALPLSNKFGVLTSPVVNDNGDLAFMGAGQTAMFYRAAGSSAPVRIMQAGDEAPGYPGSRIDLFQAPRINNSGSVVFRVDFARSDGSLQNALMEFDGTTLSTLVTGDEVAPGSGGATFDRSFNLWGLNDNGDIAFTAFPGSGTPGNTAVSALFIKPASGAPIRVVGTGDQFPGSSRRLTNIVQPVGSNLMNSGEIHLGTNLNETGYLGILVGSVNGVRVVAEGTGLTSQNSKLNNAGEVVYFSNVGEQVMKHTATGGSVRIFGRGDAVYSSTINGPGILIRELNDAGDVLFTASIQDGSVALFRKRGDDPSEVVEDEDLITKTGDVAPGTAGRTIGLVVSASMDGAGNVAFVNNLAGAPAASAILRKMAGQPLAKIAADGELSPTGGGATLQIPATTVQTKSGGSVSFASNVIGGSADFAYLRYTGPGTGTALNSNGEDLPAGARQSFRSFRVSGSGDKVGFFAQRTGGRRSIVVHNITTNTTSVLATDGDVAPETPHPAIFRLATINSVPISDSGRTVFLGTLVGVNRVGGTGLFTSKPGEGTSKIVITGVDSVGGRVISTAQINTVSPSSISPNGIVAFQGNSLGPPATQPTIYTWSETNGLARIAGVTDVVSGSSITGLIAGLAVNNAGQVVFRASLNGSAAALLVGSPTGPATKIVAPGDAWPGGGTFAGTGVPDLNDNGDVVFMSSAAGSPAKAGAFVWNGSGSPALLAENGGTTPAGGTYAMTVARADLAINNSGDILLRSDIAGGPTNSAIFVRRGTAGSLETVASQGQDAPGTEGQFETIVAGLNGLPEEQFQLDELGNIAFQNVYSDGTNRAFGNWRIRPDNTSEEILVRGVVRPEFGGGTAVVSTGSISWNSNSRYPIWARVTGGNFTEGIFLSVPKVCNDTPAGNDVPVTVTDSTTGEAPLTMTFDNVETPGETTLTTSAAGPTVPTAFQIGDPPLFFNIETTATFSGFIEVCLDVSGVTFPSGGNIRLLHFENNRWKDITTSGPTGGIICGRTRSLSPFTVAEQTGEFEDIEPPMLNPIVNPDPVLLNGTATVSANADDGGGSGVASQSCGELDTSSVGTKSVTCSATDNEGNTASATVNYRVVYDFAGFFQPIDNLPALNSVNSGASIPVKFSLAGNQGVGVLAGAPTSSTIACDSTDPVSEIEETISSPGGSGLSYDALTGQYTYVWKTNKAWKGTCRLLNVRFIDDNVYRAKFRFH